MANKCELVINKLENSQINGFKNSNFKNYKPNTKLKVFQFFGFIKGKRITSRREFELVSKAVKRSIPMPKPAAGGIPYSNASTKSLSIRCASVKPCLNNSSCSLNRAACSTGLFCSE